MSNEDINNEDDLNPGNYREEAPFLFGLKKEEPYSAPQGYFEKFRLELSEKIHQKKSGWWNFFFRPIVWAPTMVALIVAGIFLFKGENAVDPDKTAVKENTFELDNISFDVLDEYVNENLLAQADTDEIMELVGLENIPSLGNSAETSESKYDVVPAIQHLDEEEMEEYIMENIDEMEVY
jgi:hypothetical protein